MHRSKLVWFLCFTLFAPLGLGQTCANLLRNGDFQDDWMTLLPVNKTLHWCHPDFFFNRRDFHPDGWTCSGSWHWEMADAPRGQRRVVLEGPKAELFQRINWVAIHDDRRLQSFADAGGFPALAPQRSRRPLSVVRDLVLRVRLSARDVPAEAGRIEVAYSPADPVLGALGERTAAATAPLPPGTYEQKWIEVRLAAAEWLAAARKGPAGKNKGEAREDVELPASVHVAIRYHGKPGRVVVERAELLAAPPAAPNLLPHGGFESLDAAGYPRGWSPQQKYRYFPPQLYYLFNTWHNAYVENRGPVAADELVAHSGRRSLTMIVAAGDEKAVVSDPVVLNQQESRLIEVQAWVQTDRIATLQIDAVDDGGRRLDGFNSVHKAPLSVGTDGWRLLRQVFRPRQPVQSLRLKLCARGVNGYTLQDTSQQPQANVVGTVWWDDVRLFEPESTPAELAQRKVVVAAEEPAASACRLDDLDFGQCLLGRNVLSAVLVNPGPAGRFVLEWSLAAPSGRKHSYRSDPLSVEHDGRVPVQVAYELAEPCPAYREYRGALSLQDAAGKELASSPLWLATWTVPIDLELGALYLRPEQQQFVRMNLGLSRETMQRLQRVRLSIVRRADGHVVGQHDVLATPAAIATQRTKIPLALRGDFDRLLLADLDVSALPVQPFADPQRNWLVRATALDAAGAALATVDSAPFCRLAHDAPQSPCGNVTIDTHNLLYAGGKPWMPWGVCYGHCPRYAGPADPGPGKYRDLAALPVWSMYDGFDTSSPSRRQDDFNCLRYVAAGVTSRDGLEKAWQGDNLYCSSAFVVPSPVFSVAELAAKAGGQAKLDAYLDFCRGAPMVISVAPGIEEAFGLFHGTDAAGLTGLKAVADYLRARTGKPVMVGHGGFWNRFEFEKAPFFDIYDPETEPLWPANLHTDLAPLIAGKSQTIWLRPQIYESVPYERWRFHTYVELMRGARGWQMAHGPGDESLFRGLHGEMERIKPAAYSHDLGPAVRVEPWIEHWSRRHDGKLTIIGATTHGIALGRWAWADNEGPAGRRVRVTRSAGAVFDPAGTDVLDVPIYLPGIHGIQYLPDARRWPAGSRLVQWVRIETGQTPLGLALLAKVDGRWTHAAAWGMWVPKPLLATPPASYWFLLTFYRHAKGFLGWGQDLVSRARAYIPQEAAAMGALPPAGQWVKLEVPLEKIGATGGLLDGLAMVHYGGQIAWGHTTLVGPDGSNTALVWGDSIELPPERLSKVKIHVAGLKAGTPVRVLFEDRTLTAADGYFSDSFSGEDLYEHFGGGNGAGYGDAPVALHVYEMASP